MAWQRSVIDGIRRDKFGTGSSKAPPLAADVHRALKKLSSEYFHDVQFIEELIRNAEDNTYGIDVRPSLEFLLTNEDVAGKGVSATLLVLNNESGLLVPVVMALCSVNSTKIGRKGIGFKSVFKVCNTPVIISNGFRIDFQDEPDEEAGLGYIVPNWTDTPTDEAIRFACGRDKLPNTVIILPLRHDKVGSVWRELMVLSLENILSLSRNRELHVAIKIADNIF
ncbi:unnamed protein product [Calypogeia fissa]